MTPNIFPLAPGEYLTAPTRQKVDSHNRDLMKLEGDGADCNRLAARLAAADPLTVDVDEIEKVAGELRRKRQANLKASVALLQARLALLPEVNSDRHAAETAAAADLESARESVTRGMRDLGFGGWLACRDTVVIQQRAQLISLADPVRIAGERYAALRDERVSVTRLQGEAKRGILAVTERMREGLREAAATDAPTKAPFVPGIKGFSARLLASGKAR